MNIFSHQFRCLTGGVSKFACPSACLIFCYYLEKLGTLLILLIAMETAQNTFYLCKLLDEKEDCIVDIEGDIFYPILSLGSVKETKERLSSLHFEPMNFFSLAMDSIIKFCPE